MIVSDVAGTTRDSVDSSVTFHGRDYILIDTAGLRRKNKIKEDLERYSVIRAIAAVEKADVVIVMLHWGVEDSDVVTEYQRTLAQRFADAGTTMILGSHPHVLRDIEPFTAADGHQMVCVYSLGNFISAQDRARNLISGVYNFSINVTDGKTEIGYTEFIPIVTHYDWGFKDLRLYKLSDYTRELAEEHGVNKYDDMSLDMIYDYLEKHNLYRRIDEE